MSRLFTTFLLLLAAAFVVYCREELEAVEMAREAMASGRARYEMVNGPGHDGALTDCVKLYEAAESRLARLESNSSHDDALTLLSAALASHDTCLDGLGERVGLFEARQAQNLTGLIRWALALYSAETRRKGDHYILN